MIIASWKLIKLWSPHNGYSLSIVSRWRRSENFLKSMDYKQKFLKVITRSDSFFYFKMYAFQGKKKQFSNFFTSILFSFFSRLTLDTEQLWWYLHKNINAYSTSSRSSFYWKIETFHEGIYWLEYRGVLTLLIHSLLYIERSCYYYIEFSS